MSSSNSSGSEMSLSSSFRAKVMQMKNWRPKSTPSNRDRLELYALHKQSVSGDAPSSSTTTSSTTGGESTSSSPAERAKLNAWRTKKGLTKTQAMSAYLLEADRQILVYGNRTADDGGNGTSFSPRDGNTPQNTPARETGGGENGSRSANNNENSSVLLTPRGLAAIPLLCAAASETRRAYLHRLALASDSVSTDPSATNVDGGWWRRQEPLCADPDTPQAIPEMMLLKLASMLEFLSLTMSTRNTPLNSILTDTLGLSPTVLQSLLYPLHNLSLLLWMLLIFLSAVTSSTYVTLRTMAVGSKRTGVTLEEVFAQEVRPCRLGVGSLCEVHQMVSVRVLGLVLYPLGMVCELSEGLWTRLSSGGGNNGGGAGIYAASGAYAACCIGLWWYWLVVLPWLAIGGFLVATGVGWCFALIELAGM